MSKKISQSIQSIGLFTFVILLLASCDEKEKPKSNSFDRAKFLTTYADSIIMPNLEELSLFTFFLNGSIQSTNTNLTENERSILKSNWLSTYEKWMDCNSYNFGPGEEEGIKKSLLEELGTWPINKQKILDYAAASNTSFNNFDRDTRGLLTIEYLIYKGNLSDPLTLNYLKAVSAHVLKNINDVALEWQDSYRNVFIKNTGVDVGSSTSIMYNEFVKSHEFLKNFKLGLPMGKRAGQVSIEPTKVENLYSGISLTSLENHYKNLKNTWKGISKSGTLLDYSWREYLNTVEGGPALVTATEAQFNAIDMAFDNVPKDLPLEDLIVAQDPKLEILYQELQKLTRFIKSDMSSLLGIAITFSSGDGD